MKEERSIKSLLDEVRQMEQEELRTAVMHHGKKEKDGWTYRFKDECPIVVAYNCEEPCDVVVLSVRVDRKGVISIAVEEKLDRTYPFTLDAGDVFPGQLMFVTEKVV